MISTTSIDNRIGVDDRRGLNKLLGMITLGLFAALFGSSTARASTLALVQVTVPCSSDPLNGIQQVVRDPVSASISGSEQSSSASCPPGYPPGAPDFSVTTQGSASAVLASGTMRTFALAFGNSSENPSVNDSATAYTDISDTITVFAPPGTTNYAPVTIGFTLTGRLEDVGQIYGDLDINGVLIASSEADTAGQSINSFGLATCQSATQSVGITDCSVTIQTPVQLSATQNQFNFDLTVLTTTSYEGIADASSTALAFMTLPPGYTFTSVSGVFLTEPQVDDSAPEPGSLWLLGAGLAVLTWIKRRA
jgi:hypothetical protein